MALSCDRCNRVLLIVCLLVSMVSTSSASAKRGAAYDPPFDLDTGFGRSVPDAEDGTFYRSYAKPMRSHTQARGALSWRIETESRTKIAYPRLIKRPGNGSVEAVNRALEAVHGRMIKETLEHEARVRSAWGPEWIVDGMAKDGWSVAQYPIKITYVSATYLSLVETGRNGEVSGQRVFARGTTIDMRDGTIFGVKPCGSDDDLPTFVFADLLVVCTAPKYVAFFDLWEALHKKQREDAFGPFIPWVELCQRLELDFRDDASFALYLTDAGLAVHNARAMLPKEKHCVMDPSPFNPVIIPYRKLEQFMKPGQMRDELLR